MSPEKREIVKPEVWGYDVKLPTGSPNIPKNLLSFSQYVLPVST
jgi:hypothetical protein